MCRCNTLMPCTHLYFYSPGHARKRTHAYTHEPPDMHIKRVPHVAVGPRHFSAPPRWHSPGAAQLHSGAGLSLSNWCCSLSRRATAVLPPYPLDCKTSPTTSMSDYWRTPVTVIVPPANTHTERERTRAAVLSRPPSVTCRRQLSGMCETHLHCEGIPAAVQLSQSAVRTKPLGQQPTPVVA